MSASDTRASASVSLVCTGNWHLAAGEVASDARMAVAMSAESALTGLLSAAIELSKLIDCPAWVRSAVVASDRCNLIRTE